MIAADGGNNGSVLLYDSEDLISYTNERVCALPGIGSIEKLSCVYDMAAEEYRIFAESGGLCSVVTTKDLENFEPAQITADYSFEGTDGPAD